MITYKHTQIGYLMIIVTLLVLALFAWSHITSMAEIPSVDSGTNFAVSSIMLLVLLMLSSLATLTVSVDENYVRIKFGYGLFKKKLSLEKIDSVKTVKNRWYYGWGIRMYFWPTTWIFNVSGFDAVELIMKNGKRYRIGTDEPNKLESAISTEVNKLKSKNS